MRRALATAGAASLLGGGTLAVASGLHAGVETLELLLAVSALKLILMPMMMLGFCLIYNVTGPARGVALVAGAVPTATNAYILARQLGGDAPLMANLVTFTTLAAFATMPIIVYLFA